MILPHTFNPENHRYHVEGYYCLSTSDIIDLNGLGLDPRIPTKKIREASDRGHTLHSCVRDYECGVDGWDNGLTSEHMKYLDGWFAFRDAHDLKFVGDFEKPYAYQHEGTEYVVGATIDFRWLYEGDLWVPDLKTTYPLSGKAFQQKQLAWRLQTQSYTEATMFDEKFLSGLSYRRVRRGIIHIHPKLKGGYAVHEFKQDDSALWDSALRMAMEKKAVGLEPNRPNVDVYNDLRMSVEASCA